MDLPDESQWDETTCDLAVCQHPQCWATIRRIERGHPRILGTPCKTPLDAEDKLPVLTIVNISDSCFRAKRLTHRHLSGFTFTKARSSKFDSKFRGRPRKALPDRDLISHTDRSPEGSHRLKKLSVLNLNETQLPCPQDVRNMVVIWIPEEPEKHVRQEEGGRQQSKKFLSTSSVLTSENSAENPIDLVPILLESYGGGGDSDIIDTPNLAEKKHIVPSQDVEKKGKKSMVKDKSSLVLSGKQNTETQLGPPGMTVPPPSPVHLIEQLNSEFIPAWNQFDMLPQDLLKDLLTDEGKTMPCPEMKTQLAMMKKKLPLEKSRPDSAISAKMFLSIHRLTLQRPALRYPGHLKRLYCNLNTEGHRKQQQWQQQRKVKTPPKKQEAKKKSRSDPGSQNTSRKHSGTVGYDPHYGPTLEKAEQFEHEEQAQVTEEKTPEGPLASEAGKGQGPSLDPQESSKEAESRALHFPATRTLPGRESDKKQQQQMKTEGPTLKQDSTERPQMDSANYLDSFPSKENPELSKTEPSHEDISAQTEVVLEAQERTPEDLSASTSRTSWNPELKLLRILQATDDEDEDEDDQCSGAQSEEPLEA